MNAPVVFLGLSCLLGTACASVGPDLAKTGEVHVKAVSRDDVYPSTPAVRRSEDGIHLSGTVRANPYAHYGPKPLRIDLLRKSGEVIKTAHAHWHFSPTTRRKFLGPNGRYDISLPWSVEQSETIRITPLTSFEDRSSHS
jgi:hypothetical protein